MDVLWWDYNKLGLIYVLCHAIFWYGKLSKPSTYRVTLEVTELCLPPSGREYKSLDQRCRDTETSWSGSVWAIQGMWHIYNRMLSCSQFLTHVHAVFHTER